MVDCLDHYYEVFTCSRFLFFLLNVQMILSAAYVLSPVDFIPEGVSYDLYFHLVNYCPGVVLVSSTINTLFLFCVFLQQYLV